MTELENTTPCGRAARWTRLIALDELAASGMRSVKQAGHQLVVGRTADGRPFALDNRCPHEGYPLAQGELRADRLTCAWHNWKFDVTDGRCVLGGEAVRAYPLRVVDGVVEVDLAEPDPALQHAKWLASFAEGVLRYESDRAIRDGVRLLGSGFAPERLLAEIARLDALHAEYGTTHALALCADALRALPRHGGVRAMVAIAPALDICGEANQRLPLRARPAPSSETTCDAFLEALEAEDAARAEALLSGAFRSGAARSELELWMFRALSRHFTDFGHQLIYLVKAMELFDAAGDEAAADVYGALAYSAVLATREDTLPYLAGYGRRFAALEPELASLRARARTDAPFDPLALRRAVLDGTLDEACGSVVDALRGGVDARRIARALVLAAAERLLRFDLAIDADPDVAETWLWATHRFTFASAVRNALERCAHPEVLRFLFQCTAFVHSGRRMDAPSDERLDPSPEPADAAAVVAAIQAREPERALARLRGFLASALPLEDLRAALEDLCYSDPAVRPIVVAHAIKATCAAFEEREAAGDSADRDLPLEAAVRFLASPIVERRTRQTVETSIRWVAEGAVPKKLTQ